MELLKTEKIITSGQGTTAFNIRFDSNGKLHISARENGIYINGSNPGLFLESENDLQRFAEGISKAWQYHKRLKAGLKEGDGVQA